MTRAARKSPAEVPAGEQLAKVRARIAELDVLIAEDVAVIDAGYVLLACYADSSSLSRGGDAYRAKQRRYESEMARESLLRALPGLELLAVEEALNAPPEPLTAAELEAERQRVARIEREFQAAKPAHDRAAARMRGLAVPSNRRAPAVYDAADPELTADEILFTEERKRELRASGVL